MEKFSRQFVIAILSFIAEKVKMTLDDIMLMFFGVIWEEYCENGKADEIIMEELSKNITKGTTLKDLMKNCGIKNYSVLVDDTILISGSPIRLEGPITVQFEPGTPQIDCWMTPHLWGEGVKKLIMPDSITSIGSNAFSETGIEMIEFPHHVKEIPSFCCSNCDSLRSVKLPEGLTSIGYGAFMYSKALTDINLPESLETIEKSAFKGCISLPEATRRRILEIGGPEAFGDNE